MVTLEQLSALDLLIWMGTSERAGKLAFTNQSTICRRSRQVADDFNLRLLRGSEGWSLRGDAALLQLQRRVHQLARFRGRAPLRLQMPYWTRRRWSADQLAEWLINPLEHDLVCEDPVALLRSRVIDAALVTPTQMPTAVDDLLVVELHHRPIELALLGASCGRGPLKLALMPFLPRSCCTRSQQWFDALEAAKDIGNEGGGDPDGGVSVAFLTPEMREAQWQPWTILDTIEPYPYVERLVVLAEHAHQDAVARLQEVLLGQIALPAAA